MATNTPRLNLRKPGASDNVDVTADLDANFDILDNAAVVDGSSNLKLVGADHFFGVNALGAPGTRLHIGSLGDASNAYVVAEGSGASTGLVLRSSGPADVTIQDGTSVSLISLLHSAAVSATGFTNLLIRYIASGGAQLSQVTCGDPDSAGGGFRVLRVPN